MSLITPYSIEELIIESLKNGEKSSTELLYDIRVVRSRTTKQGFYAALRQLKAEDAVTMRGKIVSINTTWILCMQDIMEAMSAAYLSDNDSFGLLSLQDKERAIFYFGSSKSLDSFWGHSQNIFFHATPPTEPIYAYDEHYWIYIARSETEKKLLEEIARQKRQFLMSVGGERPLDRLIKNDFTTDYAQYNIDRAFNKENHYITVIGDYITEVTFNDAVTKPLEKLYKEHETISPELLEEFNKLLELKVRHKIKISRDNARAAVLKRRMGREFYIIKPANTQVLS